MIEFEQGSPISQENLHKKINKELHTFVDMNQEAYLEKMKKDFLLRS